MSERLLRDFIVEVLDGFGVPSQARDGVAGNVRFDAQRAPHERGSLLADEERDREDEQQSHPQAACCLVLSDDGYVLAVSRKDDPTAFGMPGGKVDPGETPEQAAARELQEETGLEATSLRLVFVHREDDGFVTSTFACRVAGEIATPEAGLVRWVRPEVLFQGPFGRYNRALWDRLGLLR